jgi:STE24 endopeptidase
LNESTATRYQRLRRRSEILTVSIGTAWLALAALSPVGGWLSAVAGAWSASASEAWRAPAHASILVALLLAGWGLVSLPAAAWSALRSSRQFRRTDMEAGRRLRLLLRDAIIGVIKAAVIAVVMIGAVVVGGAWWWAVAGGVGTVLLLSAMTIAGLMLSRSSGSHPLERVDLALRLADLAERTSGRRVPVREWAADGTEADTAAAMIAGLGPSTTILLGSSLVREWRDDEVEVVVAHELAHHARGHLWKKALLDAAVATGSLAVADVVVPVVSPESVPLVALTAWAAWWGLRPLRLAQARRHERQADRLALTWTGNTAAFRAALRRLAARHLADDHSSRAIRWFFDQHPTVAERLAAADGDTVPSR